MLRFWSLRHLASPSEASQLQYLGAVHLTVGDGGPRPPTISVTVAVGPVVTGGATGASWKHRDGEKGAEALRCVESIQHLDPKIDL